MPINKVLYGTQVLMDLTEDTVTADKLAKGETAHDASGEQITGTLETESGDFPPDEDFAEMILMAADSLQRDSLSLESGIVVKEEEKKETPTEQPTGHGQSSKGLSGR